MPLQERNLAFHGADVPESSHTETKDPSVISWGTKVAFMNLLEALAKNNCHQEKLILSGNEILVLKSCGFLKVLKILK